MSRHPDDSEDDFSLMVDPFTGRVALICPAPIIAFDDIHEFNEWVNGLLDAIPQITRSLQSSTDNAPSISKDYASTVIDTWQEQIMENIEAAPKKTGRKKSVKKQKSSMNEDPS